MRYSLTVFDKQISQRLSRTISLSNLCLGHAVTTQWSGKVHHHHFQRIICFPEPQIIYWSYIRLEFIKNAGRPTVLGWIHQSSSMPIYVLIWGNNVILCRRANPGTGLLIVSVYVTHHQWLLLLYFQILPLSSNKEVRKYLLSNESQWKLSVDHKCYFFFSVCLLVFL